MGNIDIVFEDNVIDNLDSYESALRGDVLANYYLRNNTFINVNARVAIIALSIPSFIELNDTYIHSSFNGISTILNLAPLFTKSTIRINGLHIYNNTFTSPSFVVLAPLTLNEEVLIYSVYIYDNSNNFACVIVYVEFDSEQPLFIISDTEGFMATHIESRNNSFRDTKIALKSFFQILKI